MRGTFTLTLDGVPPSKKNRMAYGKGRVFKQASVIRYEDMLQVRAMEAGSPPFGNDDLDVHIVWNVKYDKTTITVGSLGPPPKGKTGRRRDVQNIPAVVLDALQGIVYDDDKQVRRLTVEKVYE